MAFKLLSFASLASAHFFFQIPPGLGDGTDEATSPCGGFSPSASTEFTDFHVGGDAIQIRTLHAQSHLAFRATKGSSVGDAKWTTLYPTIEEFGINLFCLQSVSAPSDWAGSKGLLQIIQDSEDGVHYEVGYFIFPFYLIFESGLYILKHTLS